MIYKSYFDIFLGLWWFHQLYYYNFEELFLCGVLKILCLMWEKSRAFVYFIFAFTILSVIALIVLLLLLLGEIMDVCPDQINFFGINQASDLTFTQPFLDAFSEDHIGDLRSNNDEYIVIPKNDFDYNRALRARTVSNNRFGIGNRNRTFAATKESTKTASAFAHCEFNAGIFDLCSNDNQLYIIQVHEIANAMLLHKLDKFYLEYNKDLSNLELNKLFCNYSRESEFEANVVRDFMSKRGCLYICLEPLIKASIDLFK